MSTTLMSIKAKNEARLNEEKRQLDRKRNVMVLILKHLHDEGYVDTANQLQQEAGVVLSKFHVADNMDLPFIVHQFEEYQEVKFSRRPVVVRKKTADEVGEGRKPSRQSGSGRRRPQRFDRDTPQKPPAAKPRRGGSGKAEDAASSRGSRSERSTGSGRDSEAAVAPDDAPDLGVGGHGLTSLAGQRAQSLASEQDTYGQVGAQRRKGSRPAQGAGAADSDDGDGEDFYGERVVKALPFRNDPEMRKLAQSIARDIFTDNPNVRWSDVVELNAPKRILKEAVVMPVKYPQLFTGLLRPWNGVLLFGPPGTGKTMLAKAVATECETTFFNISASSIVSKWRGDSEKLVRCLFEMARHFSPSTIFLDEIDSIMTQRGADGAGSEHEASRRMKTELLIQMDGLAKTTDLVFVLAASNLPWELDSALLRRLEKRVLVPLPPVKARQVMIEKMLPPKHTHDLAYEELAAKTEGYSGSDIALVCKEAAMRPLRRLMNKLELLEDGRGKEYADEEVQMDPVTTEDALGALEVTRPSAHAHEAKYVEWQRAYGSV